MAGIYIHIPFCKQACFYCDFHFSTSIKKKDDMLKALRLELELRKVEFENTIVETIYFGGGTPSVLTVNELDSLIKCVYQYYSVTAHPEITLEANPDDLTEGNTDELFKGYKSIGINRLSIGVQSFYEEDLKLMNRAHNANQAEACISKAVAYFDNITIDLIYGIPGMSEERWRSNIQKALNFNIPHISSYALTVEPRTALAKMVSEGKLTVTEDLAQQHFFTLVAMLEENGFDHYELSNFGKPEFYSKNNTAYWLGKKYIGIGPSAHSFNGVERGWNVANNTKYIKALQQYELPIETEELTMADRYNERIMTGLRTMWGVSVSGIKEDFGEQYVEYLMKSVRKHLEIGVLTLNAVDGEQVLKTTPKGKFLADGIASDLFMLHLE